MGDLLTPQEIEAYRLLFDRGLKATEASRQLAQQGIKMDPQKLRVFKKNVFDKILTEEKKERMSEFILESFERTKFEFEDLVARIKRLLDKADEEGDTFKQTILVRELNSAITLALKVQGRLDKAQLNIHAQNVNILNPSELAQTFKKVQENWFLEMDAEYSNGKFVLNNPTPELIDDFNKWRAMQLREAKPAGGD